MSSQQDKPLGRAVLALALVVFSFGFTSAQSAGAQSSAAPSAAAPASAKTQLDLKVLDPAGRPVSGASVSLVCFSLAGESTTSKSTATTDSAGHVRFSQAATGRCRYTVSAEGFETSKQSAELSAGKNQFTTRLHLETVKNEIVVVSSMPELATERRVPGSDIQNAGHEDLAEFFRHVEGLSAVRRGAVNLEPSIRGLQEDQVGMFVDGTRTFAAGPGRMDSNISHVGSHATQSLRVVKGPYALAWGAGTLAALDIETIRPNFTASDWQWNGSLGVQYGESASNLDAHAGVWGSNDRLRFYLGGGRRDGDDYEAGDGSLVPADYESTETRFRFGFRPNENLVIDASGGYQEQFDLDYPGRLLDATYFYARSAALDLTWNGDGAVSEVVGQIYSNRKDHRMNNDEKPTAQPAPGRVPPFAIAVDLPTESNTQGGRFRLRFDRDQTEWSFGTDYYRVEQTASRTVSRRSNGFVLFEDIVWPDAEIEDVGGWGQVVWSVGKARLGATLRVDEVDAIADNLSPFFSANTIGSPNHDGSSKHGETNVSAAVSAAIDVNDQWSMNVGVGRAVRTATVSERYSDRFPSTKFQLAAEFMGNPLLDPEESLELNVGGRGVFGGGGAAGDLVVDIEVFYRTIDNYITVVPDASLSRRLPLSPPTVYRYVNGSEANYFGGELMLRHRVNANVSWRGSLSYVHAEDEALDEPVLGIAPLHGEVGVRFQTLQQRLWIDLSTRFADRQDRVASSRFEQETPGYAVYDLAVGYELAGGWTLKAAVENLSDHAYAEHLNSPNPFSRMRILEIGRNARIGFTYGF